MPVLNFRTTFSHAAGFCWTLSGFRLVESEVRGHQPLVVTRNRVLVQDRGRFGSRRDTTPGVASSAPAARLIARILVTCVSVMPLLSPEI